MILILSRLFRAWRERNAAASHDAVDAAVIPAPTSLIAGTKSHPGRRTPAGGGPLTLLAHQVRFDLLAAFRNPRARFFTIAFPIILLVILAGVFGHGTTVVDGVHVKLSHFYIPGILAMSIITSAYATLVVSIASARETGILKRRRATPVSATILIGGQALATLVTTAAMTAVLLLIGRFAYGFSVAPGALVAIACTVIVGTLSFACISYAVAGLIGSVDAAQPIVQATVMPLYFISGIWIPNENLSHTLQSIASVFPVEHLASALHLASVHSSFSAAFAPKDLLVLAIWGLAAAAIAARRFSWLPSVATA
ncbi:MAG TPA: ABC transporter permease [Solirubrobacteraceae bacterium]|nr:ABC transporter permease [Solirubrobacteraceae bacterium]